MSIQFIDQASSLSIFTGTDEETGEPLPTETWSQKAWAAEFAEALSLDGLVLSWGACNVYLHGETYAVTEGAYEFSADADYPTAIVIWLDTESDDNLTIDIIVLDGEHVPPAAPAVAGDFLRLAWGTIGAGATEMTLNVLRHYKEV